MANPWLKKNPFMSMWLSGANSVANTARVRIAAEAKRQTTAAVRAGFGERRHNGVTFGPALRDRCAAGRVTGQGAG